MTVATKGTHLLCRHDGCGWVETLKQPGEAPDFCPGCKQEQAWKIVDDFCAALSRSDRRFLRSHRISSDE